MEKQSERRGLALGVVVATSASVLGLAAWYVRRQRKLHAVLAAIDEINLKDPRADALQEEELKLASAEQSLTAPKEWLYGQRMSRRLRCFAPWASHVVQIAARAQHVKRWVSERKAYPEGTAGYRQWRTGTVPKKANDKALQDLGKMHAEIAKEEMLKVGYSTKEASRVTKLLTKQDIKGDKERGPYRW
eukprot:g23843.t1